jgi:putative DNA primase/helicase
MKRQGLSMAFDGTPYAHKPRDIHEEARGRWKSIFPAIGVSDQWLTGKHGPCPMCGGKDRYRFTNIYARGEYYCNFCGPGTGIDLAMGVLKLPLRDVIAIVRKAAAGAPVHMVKPSHSSVRMQQYIADLWRTADRVQPHDVCAQYLQARGVQPEPLALEIKYSSRVVYTHDDKTRTYHPAMIARYVAPDTIERTVHVTYLESGGRKAAVPKPKKLGPGIKPPGGAVRLFRSAETMGIAEGIETALAAQRLFDVPVWAALNDGGLLKWVPPASAKNILIFGDNDKSFAGQSAAYGLAQRLRNMGRTVEVRLPDEAGDDWNDVLVGRAG